LFLDAQSAPAIEAIDGQSVGRGRVQREGGPVEEIRLIVPNRPGVVADLALTLGRAGISIQDMSLSPRPDNLSGEVALWVALDDAAQARALIGEHEAAGQ